MKSDQKVAYIDLEIIDNEKPEPDKVLFVKLSVLETNDSPVIIGQKKMCMVTIIDDDSKIFKFEFNLV